MALELKVSNNLKILAGHLSELIKAQTHTQDVFRPVYIVTQTDGMNIWLKQRLAESLGIAANFRFLKPHELISKVYYLLGGQSSELLSAENMQWIIYRLLGEDDFIKQFPTVSDYYVKQASDNDVKRMALAKKIADLFDQYQVYRFEMVTEWNQSAKEKDKTEWQEYLWNRAKVLLQDRLPDKTTTHRFITEALKDALKQERLRAALPAVYVFGLSVTTAYHTQLYHALGQIIDIHFLMMNPSPGVYWFDDKSEKLIARLKEKKYKNVDSLQQGNTLLTGWGKVLQDTYSLLFENEELINSYEELDVTEPAGETLLSNVQKAIYNSDTAKPNIDEAFLTDKSITINSCYSPIRETEVLYNYLVGLVAKSPGRLSARDILVLVSDVEAYAPYIKAIFKNAPYKFRYTIADEPYSSGDTISAALSALLSITEDNLTAENVLQLLEFSFIRKRWRITDMSGIRDAVNKANIRFGIENEIENESCFVSWKYGLQRIMYGICMSSEEEYGSGPEGFYPVDIAEGAAADQLVRFTHFVKILIHSLKDREAKRTLPEWAEYTRQLIDNMICEPDETTDEEYRIIQDHLQSYNLDTDLFNEQIGYRVFANSFLESLSIPSRTGSFVAGGITFCSLIPMRSIPYKVVALLGLNFDKFPRKDNTLSFNLMTGKPQRGDRSIKENDKHLFLETVLSAEEFLYISYTGQSAKDNSVIPPSALTDELIDYIVSAFPHKTAARDLLITKHPLHGFSHKYNREDDESGLITYLQGRKINDLNLVLPEKNTDTLSFDVIDLHALTRFFQNPVKGYYNNVLKIYYGEDDVLLLENEIFEIGPLEKWGLKHDLLTTNGTPLTVTRDRLVKSGKLPLKSMADVILQETEAEVSPVKAFFNCCIENRKRIKVSVDQVVGSIKLTGELEIYEDKLVTVSFSKSECKYLIDSYIKYLAARSAGLEVKMFFISAHKNDVFPAESLSEAEAKGRLEALIELYKEGHERILPYSPEFYSDPNALDKITADTFITIIEKRIYRYNNNLNDPYILNEWHNNFYEEDGCAERFTENCNLLLKPLAELFPTYAF